MYQNIGNELHLGELLSIESIQSLWSGYGELVRLVFSKKSVIVKHIQLPLYSTLSSKKNLKHPRGWDSELSHQRKLRSFKIEINWYQEFSKEKDERCQIPLGLRCFNSEDESLLVMEDLQSLGLGYTTKNVTKNHLKSSLSWLANFHAKYMNKKSEYIWDIGTYWHLDTRPDELEMLEEMELKKFAKVIDRALNEVKYQTFVHGDAKVANFCFNKDGVKCAAVDFQYVGHGCGMKDVILFISSCLDSTECEKMENWLLDTYFGELKNALEYYQPTLNFVEIEKEWRKMYYIAWADFFRFLKGWSPDHYKINFYTENITKKALKLLQSK